MAALEGVMHSVLKSFLEEAAMGLTVRDFNDLMRLLDRHPEWVEALRQRLLTRELLESPKTLRRRPPSWRTPTSWSGAAPGPPAARPFGWWRSSRRWTPTMRSGRRSCARPGRRRRGSPWRQVPRSTPWRLGPRGDQGVWWLTDGRPYAPHEIPQES